MNDDDASREWVSTAWTRHLRRTLLVVADARVARAAVVGLWLSTYADASGENAYPDLKTLSTLAGCSEEYAGRALRFLRAVGLLKTRRRPNQSSVHTLLVPTGPVPWSDHLELLLDSRHKRKHAAAKAAAIAALVTEGEHARVPEPERDRESGTRARRGFQDTPEDPGTRACSGSEGEHARVPEPERDGGVPSPCPTDDQSTEHTMAWPSPQPQQRVPAGREQGPLGHVPALTAKEAGSIGRPLNRGGHDVELPGFAAGHQLQEQLRQKRAAREAAGEQPPRVLRWHSGAGAPDTAAAG